VKNVLRCTFLAALLFALPAAFGAEKPKPALIVFAAASLTDTLQKISDEYTKTSGVPVKLSFAASSALAKQIETGAGADVFFSADQEWMDYLDKKGLTKAGTRTEMLGNRLVLIAPADSKTSVKLGPNAPVLAALGANGRLATGDPDSVPVGRYARQALTSLGVWTALEPRLARAENVRVALSYVARGEAPLGIVYATDAAVERKVRVVDTFPESSHPPITYPVAATKVGQTAALDYLQFLRSAAASSIFTKAGFKVLGARSAMATSGGCAGFAFDLSKELALFGGKAADVVAASTADKATPIDADKAYRVALANQASVRFAAEPGKVTVADGSHAGVLKLPAPTSQTLRVTLDEAAWIDLVSAGKSIDSTRHTGSHDCRLVRKSVEFAVKPGAPLLLQISGSTKPVVNVAVTTS
jgi:molybdate transport system substrate-binding protein